MWLLIQKGVCDQNRCQRSRSVNTFNSIQFLVSDQAAADFRETTAIIAVLNDLRTRVLQMNAAAYDEALSALNRLVEILGKENGQDVQQETRKNMFNLGLHQVILDNFVLNIQLERDSSPRDGGKQAMDLAKDPKLKDLVQRAYQVLLELVRGFAKAQQACIPLFGVFKSHVGIEKLNVVGTVAEVLRDRTDLWVHVQKSVCEDMVAAIKTHGRRSRWLSFLEIFCEVNGVWVPAVKPFQAQIFQLLIQDKEVLLDLTLDYNNSPFLPRDDPRYGKTRFQLLQDRDYKEKYFSLAHYHASSLRILALCCAGKNRVVQASTCAVIPLSVILDNLLHLEKPPSGAEPIRDCDAIHHVKKGWAHLLLEAYLNSDECYEKCGIVQREHEMIVSGQRNCLLQEICSVFELLSKRLDGLKSGVEADKISGKGDEAGGDINQHVEYAAYCIEITQVLYTSVLCGNLDVEIQKKLPDVLEHLKKKLEHSARNLHQTVQGLPLYANASSAHRPRKISTSLVEMLSRISGGSSLSVNPALKTRKNPPERKEKFLKGWGLFRTYLARFLNVSSLDGKCSEDEIKEIATMFGRSTSGENDDRGALRPLIDLLRSKGQKDFELIEAGVRVLRAILYLNPSELNQEEQVREYKLFLKNQSPTDARKMEPRFTSLQAKLANMGAVNVILRCLPCPDNAVVNATLKLAITLLDGGNDVVQEIFHKALTTSGGKPSVGGKFSTKSLFFEKLHQLFEDAITESKESKRRLKRRARTMEELKKAGIDTTLHDSEHDEDEKRREIEEQMAGVSKMMRYFC